MASLLTSRIMALYCGRQTSSICAISRCWQHTIAARAPSYNNTGESTYNHTSSSVIPIFQYASQYGDRIALRDCHGDYTYRGIFLSSRQFSGDISNLLNGKRQERVAFLCPNDATYLITQWACWMSGQIAVPMNASHPPALMEHYITNSEAELLVTTEEFAETMEKLAVKTERKLLVLDETLRVLAMKPAAKSSLLPDPETPIVETLVAGQEPPFYDTSNAMIIYTSGTTALPKGVVISHGNLQAQVHSMLTAWGWNSKDIVLHTLPLHHIHGIVNVLTCPLVVGARCVMMPKFEASKVWSQLVAINMPANERVNMYMAVPSIYVKLIEEFDKIFTKNARMQEYIKSVCSQKIRLMVSGSAPLPTPLAQRWEDITGHRLLERYGMTETGMVLSNPLEGDRRLGFVGTPLPGVQVQLSKTDSSQDKMVVKSSVTQSNVLPKEQMAGELLVKGPSVFKGYWNMPETTEKEFTVDGWFKTGDTMIYEDGVYRVLGRTNIDIIKTGGYKVSALEVETHLLGHPDIQDCVVVGLPDLTWGQKVAAVVIAREGQEVILSKLREWSKDKMAPYAIPTVLRVVEKLPKNAMGKVNKKELLSHLFAKNQH